MGKSKSILWILKTDELKKNSDDRIFIKSSNKRRDNMNTSTRTSWALIVTHLPDYEIWTISTLLYMEISQIN